MANLASISMLAEVDGAILVDKPAGLAAHDVERAVKAHFNLVKTAHGAMLDPGASGLFILLLGDGTRLAESLMGADSVYAGRIRLGRETDTYDAHGNVLAEKDCSGVTRERLDAALKDFRGDIYQTSPAFSAVRIAGRPNWEVVKTDKGGGERLVHVYRLAATAFELPFVSFELSCTKGVSARTLAHDLGRSLGCGATLEELRRVKCGKFKVEDAMPFMDLVQLDAVAFKSRVLSVFEASGR
jgi:tRNA pseudouridine55 synthase